jgi:hypothetical protein
LYHVIFIIIIINVTTAQSRALASLTGFVTVKYVTMWVISPTINLVLVILIQPPETSSGGATIDISSEAGETRVRNMAAEFCLRASFHARRVLLRAVNLRHGTRRLYFPSEGKRATDFIALKNHRPRPGLSPQTLGPVASTLTTEGDII